MNKRIPVFDDCSTLERFTGADYFDDKSLLVYAASTYDEESGRKIASIVLKNIKDGTSEVISSGHGEGSPAFSPDGSRLLYLSAEAGMVNGGVNNGVSLTGLGKTFNFTGVNHEGYARFGF